MSKIIKLVIAFIFIFIIGTFYLSLNKNVEYDTKYLVGKKIAKVELKNFYNNDYFTNEDFNKNDFILINFWASWCSPCILEHPILMHLAEEKKIDILGINFKDKKNNADKFLKDLGNPYDYLAKDELGKQSIIFGIYGIPESILIDSNSIILKKFVGPLNIDDLNLIKSIIK